MNQETIKIVNKIIDIMNDLEWDRERLSTSGQETLDEFWELIEREGNLATLESYIKLNEIICCKEERYE